METNITAVKIKVAGEQDFTQNILKSLPLFSFLLSCLFWVKAAYSIIFKKNLILYCSFTTVTYMVSPTCKTDNHTFLLTFLTKIFICD